jgi:hypothetical protein
MAVINRFRVALSIIVCIAGAHIPALVMAQAPTIPAPIFLESVYVGSNGNQQRGPGQAFIGMSACVTNPNGACATANSSTSAFGPSANFSTIIGGGTATLETGGSAQVSYGYEVIDANNPTVNALYVPLIITGLATAATVGTNTVHGPNYTYLTQAAQAQIGYSDKIYSVTSNTANGNVPANGNLFDSFSVGTNSLNYLSLVAECTSEINGGASIVGTCEASADPILAIEPSFLAANPGLSIVYSSGVASGITTYSAGHLRMPTVTVGNVVYSDVVVTLGGIVIPPNGTSPSSNGATYDPATQHLTVPSVLVGSTTYFNVVITVGSLVSIGGVTGADQFNGTYLTIPSVLFNGSVYSNVVINIGSKISVAGGMPNSAQDEYDPQTNILTIPGIQYNGTVYSNVTVTPTHIVSVGGIGT